MQTAEALAAQLEAARAEAEVMVREAGAAKEAAREEQAAVRKQLEAAQHQAAEANKVRARAGQVFGDWVLLSCGCGRWGATGLPVGGWTGAGGGRVGGSRCGACQWNVWGGVQRQRPRVGRHHPWVRQVAVVVVAVLMAVAAVVHTCLHGHIGPRGR